MFGQRTCVVVPQPVPQFLAGRSPDLDVHSTKPGGDGRLPHARIWQVGEYSQVSHGGLRSRIPASDKASYMALVSAFFFSGRCNVNVMTPSAVLILTCSVMAPSSGDRAIRLWQVDALEE